MAVKFQPVKIPQSGLSNIPVVNGQLIYCYDTGRVFVDTQVGRLQQGISTVSDSSSLPAIASDKLYFIKKSNKLVSFVNGACKEVNSQQGTYLPLSGGTMTGGINSSASSVLQVLGKDIIKQQKSGQYPAIAGDHIAYSGSQSEKGIVFKGKASVNQNITDGLVFYMPLSQAQDTTLYGNPVQIFGTSGVETSSYKTVDGIPCFDVTYKGGLQVSNITGLPKGSQTRTVSLWFRYNKDQTPYHILGYGKDGNNRSNFGLTSSSSNQLGIMAMTGSYTALYNLTGSTWYHFCVIYKTNTATNKPHALVYKNGTYATQIQMPDLIATEDDPYTLYLGRDISGYTGNGGWQMSGLRIFNRVLNEDQITTLANQFTTQEVKEDAFLMQFTDSKYSFKPTSDKYDQSDPSNFWTGKAVKSYADANYLPLSGGTLTGLLKLSQRPQLTTGDPVTLTNKTITTKADVTSLINQSTANYLPLAGGTMTGNITLSSTMDLTNADTANILVNGKAVTTYVTTKIKNYLPLSGGTVTGNTTFTKDVSFDTSPTSADPSQLQNLDDTQLVTAKAIKDYGSSQYISINGGTLKGSLKVQNGTDESLVAQAGRWAYIIKADNNQALYSNTGTFYRQHSDSQTIVKYGRGVQFTFGFSDQGTSAGLYLAKYSSKASVSQTRKGIQIINTGTLYHSQDSTNGWDGFSGDVSINFTNKQNTNSIAQWGPVKDLIYQQKRFLYQDCGAGDVAIASDDVIYYCQPTNTTTKYTLPTQPDNPNYTHVRRLYVKLWAGYAFSIQGPVTWYQVPDFAPGFTYRLVFQWDRATRKWLGNMFWTPQAIS